MMEINNNSSAKKEENDHEWIKKTAEIKQNDEVVRAPATSPTKHTNPNPCRPKPRVRLLTRIT